MTDDQKATFQDTLGRLKATLRFLWRVCLTAARFFFSLDASESSIYIRVYSKAVTCKGQWHHP